MPNTRILLWFALAAVLFYNYQAWMHDYQTPAGLTGQSAAGSAAAGSTLGDSLPQAASSAASPAAPAPGTATQAPAAADTKSAADAFAAPPPAIAPAGAPTAQDAAPSPSLHVTTDVLDVVINLKGGELDQADLVQYPQRKDTPHVPVRLLSREPPASLYLLQTGLIGGAGEAAA